MSGVLRSFGLPFVAVSLLLVGCGVPIAPEAITATAVSQRQADADLAEFAAASGRTSNDTALSLRPVSAGIEESTGENPRPIPTLPLSELPAATPEALEASIPAATEPAPADASSTLEPEATETVDTSDADPAGTPTEAPASTPLPEPTATPAPVVADVNASFVTEFLGLLNAQRTGRGMSSLTFNGQLSGGATAYAGYMGTANYFGHYPQDGSTPPSRLEATGYPGAYNGEALSAGQASPQVALNALLASAPHAVILLDPSSIEVGIGYGYVQNSRYRHYWVVVTGIP